VTSGQTVELTNLQPTQDTQVFSALEAFGEWCKKKNWGTCL